MRVLHFAPVYKPAWRYGGPVRSISQLCEGLAASGIDVTMLTTNANGQKKLDVPTHVPVSVDGVKVYYCPSIRTPWGLASPSLGRQINRIIGEYDLVHMSAVWHPLAISVAAAATRLGVPYVSSLRGSFTVWAWNNRGTKHRLYWRLFEKRMLQKAAALHVTCKLEMEEMKAVGVGIGQRVFIVPNGIRSEEFATRLRPANAFRTLLNVPPHSNVLLSFGRLHPQKGIDIFLRAIAPELKKSDNWIYVIAGPDERNYRSKLVALVDELDVAPKVRFQDMLVGELRQGAYGAADIFVLTSHSENFGMSVVEAMSASTPVLISDRVGIAREVELDRAGVVTKLEAGSIRAATAELMCNAESRQKYANCAVDSVKRRYDWMAVAQHMRTEYSKILAESKTG